MHRFHALPVFAFMPVYSYWYRWALVVAVRCRLHSVAYPLYVVSAAVVFTQYVIVFFNFSLFASYIHLLIALSACCPSLHSFIRLLFYHWLRMCAYVYMCICVYVQTVRPKTRPIKFVSYRIVSLHIFVSSPLFSFNAFVQYCSSMIQSFDCSVHAYNIYVANEHTNITRTWFCLCRQFLTRFQNSR